MSSHGGTGDGSYGNSKTYCDCVTTVSPFRPSSSSSFTFLCRGSQTARPPGLLVFDSGHRQSEIVLGGTANFR